MSHIGMNELSPSHKTSADREWDTPGPPMDNSQCGDTRGWKRLDWGCILRCAFVGFVLTSIVVLMLTSCATENDCPVCPAIPITASCGLSDLTYTKVDTTFSVTWKVEQTGGLQVVGSFLVVAKLCVEPVDTIFATWQANGFYGVDNLSLTHYRDKHQWPEFTLQGYAIYRDGQEPNTTDLICKTPCKIWTEQGGK